LLTIIDAKTNSEFNAVRKLCWEYREFLLKLGPKDAEIVRTFYSRETYAQIMDALEQEHSPPTGRVKLALKGSEPVGCGMNHTLMPSTAEIKRVYDRDEARGLGAGRDLMSSLIGQCRADGYSRILMDTGVPLKAAQKLYLSLGFRLRGPYQDVPELARERLVFFEMDL
jgi:GNAT superfamily N-acetyltransferase